MIIVLAAALVLLAGLFSAADAALTSFSRARAEELQAEGQAGARRLVTMLADPAPYLNTAILLRLLCEISAIVIVTREITRAYDGQLAAECAHHDRRDAGRLLRRHRGRPAHARPAAQRAGRALVGRAAELGDARCWVRCRGC